MKNLFSHLPAHLPDELIESILETSTFRLERIVSHGHASPDGFWYDQQQDEWVCLLQGSARLEIEGRSQVENLKPGDCLMIPAHQRHRVLWTTPEEITVWLAIHY